MKILMLRCSCGAAVEFMDLYPTGAVISYEDTVYEDFIREHLSHQGLTLKTEEENNEDSN